MPCLCNNSKDDIDGIRSHSQALMVQDKENNSIKALVERYNDKIRA